MQRTNGGPGNHCSGRSGSSFQSVPTAVTAAASRAASSSANGGRCAAHGCTTAAVHAAVNSSSCDGLGSTMMHEMLQESWRFPLHFNQQTLLFFIFHGIALSSDHVTTDFRLIEGGASSGYVRCVLLLQDP